MPLANPELIDQRIRELYEFHEWRNALAVLKGAHPDEWNDIVEILHFFRLRKSEIIRPGGRKSPIAESIDREFYSRGWIEKKFETKIMIDNEVYESPTHSIDCYKNRVAVEIEWNNKDPFFDRDLNNFRLLFELRAIDVGIIITRCDELQELFDLLGVGQKFGSSTTHMTKLLPRIDGGGGGGCPILVVGMKKTLYINE